MATKNIKGITVEIGGDVQGLNKALESVDKKSQSLGAELKQVNKLLKLDPNNVVLAAQKQKILSEQVENTKDRLRTLKSVQDQIERQYKSGEIDDGAYRAFQREIEDTEIALRRLENQSEDTKNKINDVSKEIKDTGEKSKDAKDKTNSFAANLKQAFTFGAVITMLQGVVSAMNAVVEESMELNADMARFEQNVSNSNNSLYAMQGHLKDVTALTGETDSSIEALSNLMAIGFDDRQMQEAVEGLSGAVIKFPDTLKIESLSDSLQETIATGKGVGQFSELLERSGMNLEKFDAEMAKAKTVADKQRIALKWLSKTGLSSVNKEYRKTNEALLNYNEASYDSSLAAAEMAESLMPLATLGKQLEAKFFGVIADGFKKITPMIIDFSEWLFGGLFGIDYDNTNLSKSISAMERGWGDAIDAGADMAQEYAIEEAAVDKLVERMDDLVDENGYLIGDKQMLQTTIEELKKYGYDVEYDAIDEQIKGYQRLQEEIEKTRAAKKYDARISQLTPGYEEALENRDRAAQNYAAMYEKLEKEKARIEAEPWSTDNAIAQYEADFKKAEEIYLGYVDTISKYENAEILFASGDVEEALKLLDGLYSTYLEPEIIRDRSKELIEASFDVLKNEGFTAMVDYLKENEQTIYDIGESMSSEYSNALQKEKDNFNKLAILYLNALRDGNTQLADALKVDLETSAQALREYGENIPSDIAEKIRNGEYQIANAASKLSSPISESFEAAGENMATSLGDGMTTNSGYVFDSSLKLVDTANDGIATGADMHSPSRVFIKHGQNLVDGLIIGMRSRESQVRSVSASIARIASNAMKAALKINSPSKVTRSYGQYFSEGLERGMLDRIRDVQNASARIAASAAMPIANTSTSSFNVYNTNNFNTTAARDGAALVRQINRDLGAMYYKR